MTTLQLNAARSARRGAGYSAQRTLKNPIGCSGVGLHTGDHVSMTLRPGPVDSGVVFRRVDIAGHGTSIPALWDQVVDTTMCTTLGDGNGVRVGTVEHLMAALAGAGVDNAVIEVQGAETPIMDGSAAPFVFLIECAGMVEQDAPRRVIEILTPVVVRDGDAAASLAPAAEFSVGVEIDFDNPLIGRQSCEVRLAGGAFKSDIARARTFGFHHEVAQMIAAGLARGGSLDNAVVISGDKVLNEDGLRYDDEFVRHKALDAVGDMRLAGWPIIGRYVGVRPGHALNNRLLAALFADGAAWRLVDEDDVPAADRRRAVAR